MGRLRLGYLHNRRQFEKELKDLLTQIGLRDNNVSYSEQGMQGDKYVSCDVGKAFIKSYLEKTSCPEMSELLSN